MQKREEDGWTVIRDLVLYRNHTVRYKLSAYTSISARQSPSQTAHLLRYHGIVPEAQRASMTTSRISTPVNDALTGGGFTDTFKDILRFGGGWGNVS